MPKQHHLGNLFPTYSAGKRKKLIITIGVVSCTLTLISAVTAPVYDTTCSAGYYLKNGQVCQPCQPGYYCPGGATFVVMNKCSSGYYSGYAASSCTKCPAGFQCADPTIPPIACPVHKYSSAGSLTCQDCPQGSVCQGGIATQCNPGERCFSSTTSVKIPCPAGYKCPLAYDPTVIELCPLGTYSAEGSASCTLCPQGYACPTQSMSPQQCPGGYYQDMVGQTSCKACLKGYYCDMTVSPSPVRCALGQFSPASAAACIDCPAGYMCSDQDIDTPVLCAKGTYSLGKSSFCIQCPEGYSCQDRKSKTQCAAGYYSLNGMDSCAQCPPGYECGSWGTPTPCGPGQYSAAGAASCSFCPLGNYCPQPTTPPIPCLIGYYQDQIGQNTCKKCPDGHKCVDQTIAPVMCPLGQFTDKFNQQCLVCPAGYDCSSKRFDDIKPCRQGTYALAGDGVCKMCPAGYYCKTTDLDKVECDVGFYSYEGQTTCTRCPPGYRCLDKKGKYMVKCLAGQYVDSTTLLCTDCPAGYSCPNAEGGYDTKVVCQPGTYSGPGQAHCTVCSPGKYCPWTDKPIEIDCPLGKISFGGATSCQLCPKNHECPNNVTNSTQVPCPIYFYSDEGSGRCQKCPDGKQCNDLHAVNPLSCPDGYYIQTLDWKCQPCPYGHMCPAGALSPTICPKHQYQDTMASSTCKPCPDGYFSGPGYEFCQPVPPGFTRGSVSLLDPCPDGTYSDWGFSSCKTCPDGYLCPQGGELGPHYGCPKGSYCVGGKQYKCPPGSYGLIERARTEIEGCELCPAGYYCIAGTVNFELHPCPRGNYCPRETDVPIECPKGTYQDELYGKSINDCKLCPMGRECATATQNQGQTCQNGYFCPLGSYPQQWPCPAGFYSGYRTGLKDQSECIVCPAGHYCPSGSAEPTPVSAGYYQPHQQIGDKAASVLCPPGFYCPNTGMTQYKGYHCSPGYFCPAGSFTSTQKPCPEGTYSDSQELFDAAQCYVCPAGYKCAQAATSSTNMVPCPMNQYCPFGTKASQDLKCPAGTYAPYISSKSLDDCIPCPYGKYCLSGEDPVACPMGHYCPKGTEYGAQNPCPAGFYLDKTGAQVLGECRPCGLGSYCQEGSSSPTPCAPGQYNDFSNTASACLDCPPGRYCPLAGTDFAKKCPPGKYSSNGARVCSFCGIGTYCPNEATTLDEKSQQICPAGVYCMRDMNGQTEVDPITGATITLTNKYGLNVYPNLRDHFCEKGYYCPEGTVSMMECPAGTYNSLRGRKNILDCQKVEAGSYTDGNAQAAPVGVCDPGYYCPEGSTSSKQVPCPSGTFRSITQGSRPEDCSICTSGYYCKDAGTANPVICPQGFYCPLGTKYPEPCPEGTYGAATGLTDSMSCTKCDAGKYCGKRNLTAPQDDCDEGYYCIKGSKKPEPTDQITGDICPAGGYCLKGATAPQTCVDGKFNKFTGGTSAADCQDCWPGYYCTGQSILVTCPAGRYCPGGTANPYAVGYTNIAAAGYYAPAGSAKQFKCPRGTYQGSPEQSSCKYCEAGQYCDATDPTTFVNCPQGSYCPAYSTFVAAGTFYEKSLCPAGTYGAEDSQKSSSGCKPCDQGKYCEIAGLTAVTGACSAGYFCKKNAVSNAPQVLDSNSYFGPCPAGYYCPANVAAPQACPAGTYSPQTLQSTSATCIFCTEGYYCPTAGMSQPSLKCDVGYYCPIGSKTSKGETVADPTEKPCFANYYCPLGAPYPILCPIGFYQDLTGQGKCNSCPKGYYCALGIKSICPAGYNCP